MSIDNEKEIDILNYIKEEEDSSQRKISNSLGISLGLVNMFIKKLVNKGMIKIIKSSNKNSIKYILTPKGFNERLNSNLYFLKKNIKYFSSAKSIILEKLENIYKNNKIHDIFIFGVDDWSEIIYLAVQNFDFNMCGFIIPDKNYKTDMMKFNYKVFSLSQLTKMNLLNINLFANMENKQHLKECYENNKLKFNEINFSIFYF